MLEIVLSKGEELFAASSVTVEYKGGVREKSLMHGGIMGGLKRKIAGEQLYLKKYNSFENEGIITVTPEAPCKIAPVILNNQCIVCQTDAFICCQPGISIDIVLAGRKIEGLPWRAGHFLEKISGRGTVFIKAGSSLAEFDLSEKKKLSLLKGSFAGADFRCQSKCNTEEGK